MVDITHDIEGHEKAVNEVMDVISWCSDRLLTENEKSGLWFCLTEETIIFFAGAVDSVDLEEKMVDMSINFGPFNPDMIQTVCHEMVHVKQYLSGKLKASGVKYHSFWKGKKVIHDDMAYVDYPWEKEAYGMQDELAADYRKSIS